MHVVGQSLRGMFAQHRTGAVEVVEDEAELERVTGAQPAVEHWRAPGELIHADLAAVSKLRLGQANSRDAKEEIADDGRVDITGRRRRTGLPVRGDGLLRVETLSFRQTPGAFLVDVVDDAGRHREQAPLLGGGADQQLQPRAGGGGDGIDRSFAEDLAVDHGLEQHPVDGHLAPASGIGILDAFEVELRLRLDEALHRDGGDRLSALRHPEQLAEHRADPFRRVGRDHVVAGAALQDGSPEQAGRLADGDQRRHAEGARRLAEDGDVAGVAAEGADVFLHPAQGRQLVEQPQVGDPIVEPEEAFRPQPVVDRDADDPVSGKAAAVIDRDGARTAQEGAAVEPYHYRQAARADLGRPDIQVEVVFAACAGVAQHVPERFGVGRLWGNGSILVRRPHAGPPFGWLGRPKAVGAEWRRGVGNPFE